MRRVCKMPHDFKQRGCPAHARRALRIVMRLHLLCLVHASQHHSTRNAETPPHQAHPAGTTLSALPDAVDTLALLRAAAAAAHLSASLLGAARPSSRPPDHAPAVAARSVLCLAHAPALLCRLHRRQRRQPPCAAAMVRPSG